MLKRIFIPGSEWLYLKLYCGIKFSDKLLLECVMPLFERDHIICNFFFIRYTDPDYHLRIRIKVDNPNKFHDILFYFYSLTNVFVDLKLVWKIQLDTYKREIERYGENTMELSEQFFKIDSIYTLRLLHIINENEDETVRWLYSLCAIDKILNAFKFELSEKIYLLQKLSVSFGKEFGLNKGLKLQLDKKYSDNRLNIRNFFERKNGNQEYITIYNLLDDFENSITVVSVAIIEILEIHNSSISKNDLVSNFIHMHCNRLFISNQRTHELVLYNLLYKHYSSVMARSKIKA